MEWLKMSPEYRVHTAIGNDGYEGPVPWMKTKDERRKEILKKRLDEIERARLKRKAERAKERMLRLEYKMKFNRLNGEIESYEDWLKNRFTMKSFSK